MGVGRERISLILLRKHLSEGSRKRRGKRKISEKCAVPLLQRIRFFIHLGMSLVTNLTATAAATTLSTGCRCSKKPVAAATEAPFWFCLVVSQIRCYISETRFSFGK